jgi:glycosyltransferase involved in cell wall biosynthesis
MLLTSSNLKPLIKLIVDGRCFEGNLTGVGFYMLSVLERISAEPRLDISIIMRRKTNMIFPPNVKIIVEGNYFAARLKPVLWQKAFSRRLFDRCDVYWATSSFVPMFLPENTRVVVVVHDFNYKIAPKTMPYGNRFASMVWILRDIDRSNYIITNSLGTAQKVKMFTGRSVDLVIPPPIRKSLRAPVDPLRRSDFKNLGIDGPFFLAVGTHEPRKNLELLIISFLHAKRASTGAQRYQLVLVGGGGWRSSKLELLISQHKKDGVLALGYASDSLLAVLYSCCKAFVFPSVYEGFGMPVREAAAFGAMIIATDIPEIREACNGVGVFIEPSISAISSALTKCILLGANARSMKKEPILDFDIQPLLKWMYS